MANASSTYRKALEGHQQPKKVLVKVDRVTKKFDETTAVDDVSLEIHQGKSSPCSVAPVRANRPCCACSPVSSARLKGGFCSTV